MSYFTSVRITILISSQCRRRPADLRAASSGEPPAQPRAVPGAAAVPPLFRVSGAAAAAGPPVETRLLLPAVDFVRPVLSVEASFPPCSTAGVPFPYSLRLHNQSLLLQHVQISVGASEGFLYSGAAQASRPLDPY